MKIAGLLLKIIGCITLVSSSLAFLLSGLNPEPIGLKMLGGIVGSILLIILGRYLENMKVN